MQGSLTVCRSFLYCKNLICVINVLMFVQILSIELVIIELYARAVQMRYFNCIPINIEDYINLLLFGCVIVLILTKPLCLN